MFIRWSGHKDQQTSMETLAGVVCDSHNRYYRFEVDVTGLGVDKLAEIVNETSLAVTREVVNREAVGADLTTGTLALGTAVGKEQPGRAHCDGLPQHCPPQGLPAGFRH